ncbi:MAG TPA: class I SAM-dependent methyltransferase [Synergistales bacterium]|nr:class I SAM-dependent methyltransferase [Synergistales bacterium]HPC75973.1 class I SAM-dependent methyltransferase [Synergistales bacterium]HRS48640.1 class I SAM-dependent methyltransferase [Thermovirgaceae bacterium]HRU91381.1 class I SAM-dependent methyltransferase [Thermovirgaceae bacterium]
MNPGPFKNKGEPAGIDAQTQQFYSRNASPLAESYRFASGGIETWFDTAFPKGARILDVGCAAGRDVSLLLEGGWDAFGVDPCPELINEGLRFDAALKGRISVDALPALATIPDGSFSGVLCSAVLMHLPEESLFDAAFGLRRVLKGGGRLLVSLPLDPLGEPLAGRDERGRFHNGLSPVRLELLLSRLGFTCIGRGENPDALGRTGKRWVVLLFVLGTDGIERSIDRIESVLNRDRKVATYKLALFRALAEMGITQYNKVRWLPGGLVALPLRAVAEKWLEYYWPLISSETFIPQIQGENPLSGKPVAFRGLLTELASRYTFRGGLPAFLLEARSGNLPPGEKELYLKLLQKLSNTIRAGPVTHSGGGGTLRRVFQFDPPTTSIIMEKGIWQEFCLMGPWIRDAAVQRWAELSERISRGRVKAGQVFSLLAENPLPKREVTDARNLFQRPGFHECVWTGEPLHKKNLAIDHAIPFSLWRCNDLWNLFPVNKRINLHKSDKLPSRRLILARKGSICGTWEHYHQEYPVRINAETESFCGREIAGRAQWQDRLFSLFAEAVEVTALQRGAERWEP